MQFKLIEIYSLLSIDKISPIKIIKPRHLKLLDNAIVENYEKI